MLQLLSSFHGQDTIIGSSFGWIPLRILHIWVRVRVRVRGDVAKYEGVI